MQFFMLDHGVGRMQANIVYPREWQRVCKEQEQALTEWDAASHKQRGSKFFLCPRLFVVYKVRIPHKCAQVNYSHLIGHYGHVGSGALPLNLLEDIVSPSINSHGQLFRSC